MILKLVKWSVSCLTVLLVFNCVVAPAQKMSWTILFDGKSTDAWRGYKRDSFPTGGWVIDNGALKTVVGAPDAERADIITKNKYQNFELELEWRISPGGNSGVMYKVAEIDGPAWHTGPEMQVLDDDKHPDAKLGKDGNRTAGSLYDLLPAAKNKTLLPVGQFNKARLVINNNRVQHFLNGTKVVDYTIGSPEMNKLLAESKFKDLPRFAKEPEGHIVLQHHGEQVWFRNIRVRQLPASKKP